MRRRRLLARIRAYRRKLSALPEASNVATEIGEDSLHPVLVSQTTVRRHAKLKNHNRHHRRARFHHAGTTIRGRNGKRYDNISIVPVYLHEMYNNFFGGHATPQQVCDVLNDTWIDPSMEIKFYVVDRE